MFTLVQRALCRACLKAITDPIRKRHREEWARQVIATRLPRLDGTALVLCKRCGATWQGWPDERCEWCEERAERMERDERHELLWPPWMLNGQGPRYEQLSPESQAVWNTTRGLKDDANTLDAWITQLVDATAKGVITEDDARQAVQRATEAMRGTR